MDGDPRLVRRLVPAVQREMPRRLYGPTMAQGCPFFISPIGMWLRGSVHRPFRRFGAVIAALRRRRSSTSARGERVRDRILSRDTKPNRRYVRTVHGDRDHKPTNRLYLDHGPRYLMRGDLDRLMRYHQGMWFWNPDRRGRP